MRLASFQHPPSIPPFLTLPKQTRGDADEGLQKFAEGKRVDEIAVGGGGVAVAVTRFPSEQKRPIGPLVLVGVRDGVLWLIDRYLVCLVTILFMQIFLYASQVHCFTPTNNV